MVGDDEKIEPESYENLIIDDMQLKEGFKPEDRTFLNKFKKLRKLSVNNVHMKTLDNLPEIPLQKLEISDNQIKDEELKKIVAAYKDSLVSLKAGGNKLTSLDQVVDMVKGLPNLIKLDLSDNEVCKAQGYRDKLFGANDQLQILDQKTKDGEEVDASSDDDDYGEEGEFDLYGSENHEVLEKLDPETREKYIKGEMSMEEMAALGLLQAADYGEEGEFEMDEEGEEDQDDNKKQKTN